MGRADVAERIRRSRRHLHRANNFLAGSRTQQPAGGMQRAPRDHDRGAPPAKGHPPARKALPQSSPPRRQTLGGTEQMLRQIVQVHKPVQLNGRRAIEDNAIRQQIAQFAIEATAKKYNGLRSLSKRLKGQQPGPEASISKLLSTDLGQRMTKFITRLLGEYALLERHSPFAPDGDWMRRVLASESMTIAGGTSPVQKNMIGERILQLPKG